MKRALIYAVIASAFVCSGLARCKADDVYVVKRLDAIQFEDKKPTSTDDYVWRRGRSGPPRVVIQGEGQVHITWINRADSAQTNLAVRGATLAIKLPAARRVEGRLLVPESFDKPLASYKFTIPADEFKADGKKSFLAVKRARYRDLLGRDIPGAAWFRYQVVVAERELGIEQSREGRPRRFFGTPRGNEFEDTLSLISGGRAVSENLQLDRIIPPTRVAPETVALSSLAGITVKEFEWDKLVKDAKPKLDALASRIPDDQHALFFPSFTSLVQLAGAAHEQSLPVVSFAEPRSESADVRGRYERQLGLSMNSAAKLLGPKMIASVAMTGGDPYLRTGSDVAVLFQAKGDVGALRKMIEAQVMLATGKHPSAVREEGKIGKYAYVGRRTADRSVCSYVSTIGDSVVVTNSTWQLERIAAAAESFESSLAALDEYTFFRKRYPLGDDDESALLVISDKTIRRWCGPKWRIGTSRRTRAVALMTQMQAENLDNLVAGKVQTREVDPPKSLPDAGKFVISPEGIRSTVYGGLEFQTPIGELEFDQVTTQEAQFYRRWRDGYQSNWSNFFDPIAARLFADKKSISADLTVMPLIDRSDYDEFIELSEGTSIKPEATDPHAESVLQWTLALNPKKLTAEWGGLAQGMIRVNPFGWMGDTFTVYVDKDPFWARLAKAEDKEQFAEDHIHEIPIAMHAEVRSGFKLAAFLTAVRGFVEQTAPGMLQWQTKRHKEIAYVRVGLTQAGGDAVPDELDKLSIYYSTSGGALTVTPNEAMLKRYIDRTLARRAEKLDERTLVKPVRPLLGKSLSVQADKSLIELFKAGLAPQYQEAMRRRAWGNIHILNVWRRRFPDKDPVAVHEGLWQRRLLCPGGGKYQWNEEWQTMESTVYGHPGAPKDGPSLPPSLAGIEFGNFGLTFEEHGLRARVKLDLK